MTAAHGERRRGRPALAVALVALVLALGVAVLAFLVVSGGRDGRGGDGALAWSEQPRLMPAPGDSRERILTGLVHNRSSAQIELDAKSVKVVDADGRPLPTSATFVAGFVRGSYSGSRLGQASGFERQRTGRLARLDPGGSRPLTVGWRTEADRGPAARVEYPGGSLPIPR